MTDRKKPGTAFWATVVVVAALVGYPLSWGPAWWLVDLQVAPEKPIAILYRPVAIAAARYLPDAIGLMLAHYGAVFAPTGEVPACSRSITRAAWGLPAYP
jgi:hypothetical protein